jgi:hypothetical protein
MNRAYNGFMGTYRITARVPSPEEMGRRLGLTKKRVASVRSIMASPTKRKTAKRSTSRKTGRP